MKRIHIIVLVALVVSLFGASAAFAQDPPADNQDGRRGNRGGGQLQETIAEAIGVDVDDLREAIQDADEDATLADIITALGGDPAVVSELLIAEATENAGERVDQMLNTPLSERNVGNRGNRNAGQLFSAVVEALDVEPEAIREAVEAAEGGATWSDIITTLGGDPDAIAETVVAALTERGVSEDDATERVEAALNSAPSENRGRDGRGNRGDRVRNQLQRAIFESIGVDFDEVRDAVEAAEDDATWADIITTLGGDTEAVTETIVNFLTDRGASEEDATERAEELLNNSPKQNRPAPAPDGDAGV